MSEKNIRLRIDGRGEFEGISKDCGADMVIAYIMNFTSTGAQTDIAVFGSHELDQEVLAALLGKISAHMIDQVLGDEGSPKCRKAFEWGWKDEMSNTAKEHVKGLLAKFGDMLGSMGKKEEEDED